VGGTVAVIVVQSTANRLLDEKNLDLKASNTRLEEQRARAQERETQAIDAVKRFSDAVASEKELKNNPALEGLRKRLLKEPLAFFKDLRDRLQSDRDTTWPARDCCPPSTGRTARRDQVDDAISKGLAFRGVDPIP
jgi:hypothetical protein